MAALPPGFTLADKKAKAPPLPPGFTLKKAAQPVEEPAPKPKTDGPSLFDSIMFSVANGATLGLLDDAVDLVSPALGKSMKGQLDAAREAHPIASGIGEAGGMVGSTLAMPLGVAAKGASLGVRAVRGALTGGAIGGVYGAGEADSGLANKVEGAASGALTGTVLGGAGPYAMKGLGLAAKAATLPIRPAVNAARGFINPEKEAARRVVTALDHDTKGNPDRAVTMLQNARTQGTPLIAADTGAAAGGRTTHALMRSAANTSPEARAALEPVLNERFGTQNVRAGVVISNLVRTPANATMTRDALEQAARTSRKPFYDRAYKDGAGGILTPEIQTLAQSPVMQKAMKDAATSIQNKVATGRAMAPLSPKGIPTLEYWDQVKRNLDSAWNVAKRAGDKEVAADIDATRHALVKNLDASVPSYATARGVAASLFKANDALDAGEQAVGSRMSNTEISTGLSKMLPEERALFREGFVSKFLDNVLRSPDRRSILSQIQANPQARERVNLVLGPGASRKLDALISIESIMDMTKNALGNSTTARQLAEIGLAGGAGMAIGGANPLNPGSWTPQAIMAGILAAGSRKGLYLIDQRVTQRVGEMLASDDPQVIQKAIDLVVRNPRLLDAVGRAEQMVSRALLPVTPGVQQMTAPVAADQHGGPDGNSQ